MFAMRLYISTFRQAFSLIEVLVVLSIMSLILALILGGIQRSRLAAAKLVCQNQVKQLVLACHTYATVHQHLPTGVSPNHPLEEYPFLFWQARLLPHLEHDSLWRQIQIEYQQSRVFSNQPPHGAAATILSNMTCPLDPRRGTLKNMGDSQYALCSYLGNTGYDARRNDGVLYYSSKTKLSAILDGLSSTLIIGERPPSADLRFGWWHAGIGLENQGEADGVLGVRTRNRGQHPECGINPPGFSPGKIDNICDLYHYWSLHPGGSHFAFADGSVRFLNFTVNQFMPAVASRQGNENVNID